MRRLFRSAPAVAAILAAAGCGKGGDAVVTHPVSGQVLYDGKPAAGVQVFLFPTSAPTPPDIPSNPHGLTGPDGRFTVSTFGDGDGAPEGGYQVILLWPPEPKDGEEEVTGDRLFGWHDARRTKLSVKVKPGENALPPFKLTAVTGPPPVSEGVPGRN